MTAAQINRLLYGARPGPHDSTRWIERLIREFGATQVYGHALTARREAPAETPDDTRPVYVLDALCRIEAARARRSEKTEGEA